LQPRTGNSLISPPFSALCHSVLRLYELRACLRALTGPSEFSTSLRMSAATMEEHAAETVAPERVAGGTFTSMLHVEEKARCALFPQQTRALCTRSLPTCSLCTFCTLLNSRRTSLSACTVIARVLAA